MRPLGATSPRVWRWASGSPSRSAVAAVYHPARAEGGSATAMFSVTSIRAPRPVVDWHTSASGVERSAEEAVLEPDKVSLSSEARSQLRGADAGAGQAAPPQGDGAAPQGARGATAAPGGAPAAGQGRLSEAQRQEVQELQQRDAHVRAHEAAHQAAGGDLTGPASFSYQVGPDGRSYAVGGEVPVQARSGRTPDETIAIARRVRAAALAPADPSPADLAAAASATQVELRAMQQKRQASSQPGAGARPGTGGAAAGPITSPQANLERVIVRAPEPEPFM